MPTLARWRREPLAHFALIGLLVFGLHRVLTAPPVRELTITASLLRGLRADYQRRTGALPTAEEEASVVERFLDDEVLYREALALGLDRGDVIVRRRMIQKMQLLTEDLEPVAEPTPADLAAWLAAHPGDYTAPARVSLEHVFVDAGSGGDPERRAAALRTSLAAGGDPAALGDPFLHGRAFSRRTERELAGVFGAGFAARAVALPVGTWSEPLASTFGLHLVRVTEQLPARAPGAGEVPAAARRDWIEARRAASNRAALDRLRAAYTVRADADATHPGPLAAAR